jgi:amidophosphoribosyltransferase
MCGIIGVFNHEKAADLAALGMFAEQHRGQESCGMAVSDGKVFTLRKKMGLVKQVFTPEVLERLRGKIAIGHVRYPTKGSATAYNSQPHTVESLYGATYALASNGDVVNYHEVKEELESKGVYFKSQNDGELILKYIIYQIQNQGMSIVDAIKAMMKRIKGAFSTVLATPDKMYMIRDPYAIRPMVWGKMKDGTVVVASESCALDILGVENRMEVPPAGIIQVTEREIKLFDNNPDDYRHYKEDKHCIFELIYFSRPDSYHFQENVYEVRKKIGAELAKGDDFTPDVVVPVPDSSNFMAVGYANEKNCYFSMGLLRNHYVGRTFIKPEQTIRDESVSQKFSTLPNFFTGKKVVLIDDSIVRGTTIKKIVNMIKKAGAAEVHLRIGSPAVKFPCYYGIDTPNQTELIANQKTLEEIKDFAGADSLRYIELEDLKKCVASKDKFCHACFSGNYPIK